MRIVPDSTISLYSNIPIDNGEQLVFSSLANQVAYFQNHLERAAVPCTMVKKTGYLRLDVPGSVVSRCNYISFVNPSFDNKTVYGRIIDYDYINNECVEITYAIDYWQTWMFDVAFEDMYISREHLSEADWEKAEANPYDPTIFEFKTSEDLPISKDLEKLNYNISGQDNADGLKLALSSHSLTTSTNTLGVLIKMANINLKSIDDAYIGESGWIPAPGAYVNLPSYEFFEYLDKIAGQAFGFYYITRAMSEYRNTRYPSGAFTTTNRKEVGSGWSDANIAPFQESSFEPPLCYIYDAYGASSSAVAVQNSHMSEFFNLATRWATEQGLDNLIVDLSIIPNDIATFAGTMYEGGTPLQAGVQPAQAYAPTSKKLMRYPFCYIRIVAPNGDIKELQYEKFLEMQEGNGTAYVVISMDLTDKPTLIVAPSKYRVTGMSQASNVDTNIEDALFFNQFPTLPYNIDAFTAQVAAVANETIANRTTENAADLAAMDTATDKTAMRIRTIQAGLGSGSLSYGANSSGSTGESISMGEDGASFHTSASGSHGSNISAGVGVLSGLSNAMNMYAAGGQMNMDRQKFELRSERWLNAGSVMADPEGGVIAAQLNLTKAAYACDHYYPSNGVGATNFNYLSYCDIILMNVSLNPDVLSIYDRYFVAYGYNSGRCGIPRVINYSRGVTTETDTPHWETLNGKQVSYIKTVDCKILHSMIPVASYIKAMFDGGVRMIKGD